MPERRGRIDFLTFARLVPVAENRSALAAIQQLAATARPTGLHTTGRCSDLLFLHGPPGTGKTHLVSALVHEVCRQSRGLSVTMMAASDWPGREGEAPAEPQGVNRLAARQEPRPPDWFNADLLESDLLVIEDVQQLSASAADALRRTLDDRQGYQRPTVLTANAGPRHLTSLPERLRSRWTAGLVVGLMPFAEPSRLAILRDRAQLRQIAVRPEALALLAKMLPGSGRVIDAALDRLAELSRSRPGPVEADVVAEHFGQSIAPSVERIASQVGRYFKVDARQMRSACRYRNVLLPRQVGMYLARQLTRLSLDAIGEYFGGRDHSTVLHACRKVEAAMAHDAVLSGAVQRLQGELG
jgi:chromosomal replication initiator protein